MQQISPLLLLATAVKLVNGCLSVRRLLSSIAAGLVANSIRVEWPDRLSLVRKLVA